MGVDADVAAAARVSYGKEDITGQDPQKDAKLIRSLAQRGHTSPFEMLELKIQVQAPIFVFRQWHRHRTQSYNEISARYTVLPELFYVPETEQIGYQRADEKQARGLRDMTDVEVNQRTMERYDCQEHCERGFTLYRDLIASGWPRELARCYLPLATYSRMIAKTDLHNWMRFMSERCEPHAQYEIRVYAEAVLEITRHLWPVATEVFSEKLAKWANGE